MSSQRPLPPPGGPLAGGAPADVDHAACLAEHVGALFLSEDFSDVALRVGGRRFAAHRVVLAARSDYFRALLFGGLRESREREVELKGASLPAFHALLKYIYTGRMALAQHKEEVVLDTLGLAHQYGFCELEDAVSDYLRGALSVRNACLVFDAARLYQLQFLTKVCLAFLERHAQDILRHDSFLQLSPGALRELISRDSFYAPEADIFRAVASWAAANPEEDAGPALAAVRLPLMSLQELLGVVRPTGLVAPDTILDAIGQRQAARDCDLRYRGSFQPEENMAHPRHGTQVLQGEMRSALLDGDCLNYDMERGYTRHAINEVGDHGILIRLGTQAILNHMRMLLWDRDLRSYSYYIEVSVNQKDWVRVIDHTRYHCRSWQFLYFAPRVVRFIRIVGTNNTVNKVFHVVTFEAMYTHTPVALHNGLVVPRDNVATAEKSASVIEGVSRSRNALLNGDTKNYDWDLGYTCHQLGSGAILVQLGQPYWLGSMRLLLWDCDERSYSYYVEVSVNLWDWEVVADRTRESCRSWQLLRFTPRPVVFVRIVGTQNTANEVFHCVHLECPAQVEEPSPPAPCTLLSPPDAPAPTPASVPTSSPPSPPPPPPSTVASGGHPSTPVTLAGGDSINKEKHPLHNEEERPEKEEEKGSEGRGSSTPLAATRTPDVALPAAATVDHTEEEDVEEEEEGEGRGGEVSRRKEEKSGPSV